MKRNKTIQIKCSDEQKEMIEQYVVSQSFVDKKHYSISTYLLNFIIKEISGSLEK